MTRLPQDDALIWAVAAENGRAGLELDGAAARATAERSRAPDGGGRGSPSSDEEEMCPAVWWSPMTRLSQDDALIWAVPAENGREGALWLELDAAAARATAERPRALDGGGRGSPSSDDEETYLAVWWWPMTTLGGAMWSGGGGGAVLFRRDGGKRAAGMGCRTSIAAARRWCWRRMKKREWRRRAELAYDMRAPKSKVLNAPTVQHL
jgi:hypothetical protein